MKTSMIPKALILILTLSFAQAHSEKAHVHGQGFVSMAFEGSQGQITFECPSDSTVGFEHQARNEKEKKQEKTTLSKLGSSISQMITLDPALQCVFTPTSVLIETRKGSPHTETHAEFKVTCQNPVKGSSVTLFFTQVFPQLLKVQVQIVADDIQKSVEVTQAPVKIELK